MNVIQFLRRQYQVIRNVFDAGKKERLICSRRTVQVHVRGYTDTFDETSQRFIVERKWYFFRLTPIELFVEEVPQFALIQVGCLGWTDWKSGAPQILFDIHRKYQALKDSWTTGWNFQPQMTVAELAVIDQAL